MASRIGGRGFQNWVLYVLALGKEQSANQQKVWKVLYLPPSPQWFESTSQNSQSELLLHFFNLISSAPVRERYYKPCRKREQTTMQLRTLLLIKQCYNLMKLVDVLPKFEFLICTRKTGRKRIKHRTLYYLRLTIQMTFIYQAFSSNCIFVSSFRNKNVLIKWNWSLRSRVFLRNTVFFSSCWLFPLAGLCSSEIRSVRLVW